MAEIEVTVKTVLADLYKFIKSAVFLIGVLVVVLIVSALADISPPEWSGDLVDDLLYYAYDYEKFGLMALFWRGFIVVAVFRAIVEIISAVYQCIKKLYKNAKIN